MRFDSLSYCLINFWPLRSFVDIFRSICNRFKFLCVRQCVQIFNAIRFVCGFLEPILRLFDVNVKEFDYRNAVST